MKKIVLFILLISYSINSQNKYDFSEIKTGSGLAELLLKIMCDNKKLHSEMLIEFLQDSKEINTMIIPESRSKDYSCKIYAKDIYLHYDGIPINTAIFYNNAMKLTTDSVTYSAKNMLNKIEEENGLAKDYDNQKTFNWNKETKNIDLKIELVNGKNLEQLEDKDFAILKVKFKPIYKIPLANIHKEIKAFKKQPNYVLVPHTDNCVYDIIINDIKVEESYNPYRLYLNKYIIDKVTSVKIVAKPSPNYTEDVHFSATILDQTNNEIVKEIEGAFLGGKTVVFEADFNSELPYYPKAWTDGIDLRKEKKLKEKVIALYDKLGKAILAKDEQVLNNMFYQCQYETQQLSYDTKFQTARGKWEMLLRLHENIKYTISKDFDIKFNAKGKLIYTQPNDNEEMLIFDKKSYTDNLNFYLYQPKESNELKIIR